MTMRKRILLLLTALIFAIQAPAEPISKDGSFLKSLNREIAKQTDHKEILQLMTAYDVPGVSVAVIKNKQLLWAKGFGVIQAGAIKSIDSETVFSVGSISKVCTAMITLKQVDNKKLDLNKDVNDYLTQWKIPSNRNTRDYSVTLKNILSHTAGLSVHGFGDFQPGERLPNTVEILNGQYPAKNSAVRVIFEPGSQFKYSGGGTTVQQLILEELFNNDFDEIAKNQLFNPLNMKRSSYQNPLPTNFGNIAKAHGRTGQPRALPRGYEAMPEKAASGLWTTPTDLSKVIISLMNSYEGEEEEFLSPLLTKQMMVPIAPGKFGLGPIINEELTFQHGGSNDSYKSFFQGNLKTGNGFVIFTNGANGGRFNKELRGVFENLQK